MRIFILLLIFFQSFNLLAQRPNGNFKIPEYNPQIELGIVKYDDVKLIKKTKITDELIQNKIKRLVINFNNQIDEFLLLNKDMFDAIKIYADSKRNAAFQNRDLNAMKQVRMDINEKEFPLKEQIKSMEDKLDSDFKNVLSENKFKKWLKYKRTEKEKLRPKVERNEPLANIGSRRTNGRRR